MPVLVIAGRRRTIENHRHKVFPVRRPQIVDKCSELMVHLPGFKFQVSCFRSKSNLKPETHNLKLPTTSRAPTAEISAAAEAAKSASAPTAAATASPGRTARSAAAAAGA